MGRAITASFIVALAFYISHAIAQPIPITDCMTMGAARSYVVVKDLHTESGSCLVVGGDLITIDLAGFTISGGGLAAGNNTGLGIHGPERRNVAVRNGTVAGFQFGVFVGPGSVVEGVRTFGNDYGIAAFGIVKSNTAIFSRIAGIAGSGVITGNIVQESTRDGIVASDGSTVTGNTAINNRNGIGINAGKSSTVTGNTASNNATGINVGEGSTVTDNIASDNGIGITVEVGSTINNNTVRENITGLVVTCPSNIIGNTGNVVLNGSPACRRLENLPPP